MAAQQQTPSSARPPPDVPADPSVSNTLTQYLRNFALWARQGFADSLRSHEAQPGLMVRAYDTAPGANPQVFMIEVDSAGVIRARAMPLGGPQ
jgi:hypothetical protein